MSSVIVQHRETKNTASPLYVSDKKLEHMVQHPSLQALYYSRSMNELGLEIASNMDFVAKNHGFFPHMFNLAAQNFPQRATEILNF